jgi:branched-subunit amino acid transport protein
MITVWATVLVASLGCYGLKLAGVSLPESVLNHPRVQRTAGLLPVAMLTALVVTDLFDANGRRLTRARRDRGRRHRAPVRPVPVVVFLLAITTTAVARLVS